MAYSPLPDSDPPHFIGLMSGTSLDGVDGVLASFIERDDGTCRATVLGSAHQPFTAELRREVLALQNPGPNEIDRAARAAQQLAHAYAAVVAQLKQQAPGQAPAPRIDAIGVHGQTIRHRPELGYTIQLNHPALLAELTGSDVIADFRSRDVAAGGQGAPLVPAFHQALFADPMADTVLLNLGGMANISILPARARQAPVLGFDTGPGNVLLDAWIERACRQPFDTDGAWAASGHVLPDLLQRLRAAPFFALPPPKSTGRDLFSPAWLDRQLQSWGTAAAADIQATLAALTASTVADAIARHAPHSSRLYVCGGGAKNGDLLHRLAAELAQRGMTVQVDTTDALGIAPQQVEALAFAWLAWRFRQRLPGNLSTVTGAAGARILGALYPA